MILQVYNEHVCHRVNYSNNSNDHICNALSEHSCTYVITNVVTFQVDSRIMQKLVFIVVAIIVMALASCTYAKKKKRKFGKYMLDIRWT